MSKNKQNQYSTQPTKEQEPIDLPPLEKDKQTPIYDGGNFSLETNTEDSLENQTMVPQARETIFSDPEVDLEEEQERIRRDRSVGDLTQDDVLDSVSLTAKTSLLGVIKYIDEMRKCNGHRNILMSDRNYIENMGPFLQKELYRNIMDIITKTDDVDFKKSMDFLMQLFQREGGENDPLNFFSLSRFQENLKMNIVDIHCYPNLMRMLTVLADPVNRSKNIRTVINFDKSLEYGFSDSARSRLINYFN